MKDVKTERSPVEELEEEIKAHLIALHKRLTHEEMNKQLSPTPTTLLLSQDLRRLNDLIYLMMIRPDKLAKFVAKRKHKDWRNSVKLVNELEGDQLKKQEAELREFILHKTGHGAYCNAIVYCGEPCNCGLRELQERLANIALLREEKI